jgi:glycosyltransferase involved in cell wall biosynthesis
LASDDPRRAETRATEARYIPACDYVTAASPGVADAYGRLARRRPAVVLNVFPLADRPAAPLPVQRGPLQLYWFSQTLGPSRGLEQAVAALAELTDGSAELHLRGFCSPGYRAATEDRARNLGVHANRIIWHPPAPPDEMTRLAAHHAVGLSLETGETPNADVALANKVFTYLLAGVPVIATATTAHRELAKECASAMRLVAPHDAKGLAAIVRQWMDSPIDLAHARESAWRLGTEQFNWDREQHTFLEIIQSVLDSGHGSKDSGRGLAS